MLNLDIIKEISYYADYETTLKLFEICEELNSSELNSSKLNSSKLNSWKRKCMVLFPDQPYLDFYTGPENYLIRERKDFVVDALFDGCDHSKQYPYNCKNLLYEYDDKLKDRIYHYSGIAPTLVRINPIKRFILLKRDENKLITELMQCDDKNTTINLIKNDIKINIEISMNNVLDYEDAEYMILDLMYIVPCFNKLGTLKPITEERSSYCYWAHYNGPRWNL